MEALIEKFIFLVVKAYLKARLDPEIIKLSQDSVFIASTRNKDDEAFISHAHTDGWSDDDKLPVKDNH